MKCLVFAALVYAPQGHAQSNTATLETLAAEALAAFEARDFPRAIALRQARLQALTAVHGETSLQAVAARKELSDLQDEYADALYASGKYREALPLYLEVLAERKRDSGVESMDAAYSLTGVAQTLKAMGQYAKALPFYQLAIAITEKMQGPEHPDTGISLNNLATLYESMGQYAEALPLSRRALVISEKAAGAEHASAGVLLNNLAALHKSMGQYAEALPLYRRAIAISEKAQGSEHPSTGLALNNLAALYEIMGQYVEALPLLQRSLAIAEKTRGADHPDTAIRLNNLALLYQSMGQTIEALPLYWRALAITEKAHGPDHPDTGVRLNNIALLYQFLGQYAQALPLFRRSLAIAEKAEGPEHSSTGTSLNNLALLYKSMGRYSEALPLYKRALLIANHTGLPELAWTVQDNLRVAYSHEKHTDLAIFFGKQAVNTLQGMRTNLAMLDQELQRGFLKNKIPAYRGLAELLVEQGRLPEAQQVLAMLKEEEFFDFIRRESRQDNRSTTVAFNTSEEPWRRRYGEISNQLGGIGKELAELDRKARDGLSDAESVRREQLRNDRKVAQQAFDAFLGDFMRELAGASVQRNRDVGERGLANLRALQGTLGSLAHSAVAVHYLMGEEQLRILVTTPSIQVARSVPIKAKDLNQMIAFFQSQLQDPRLNPLPMAQELYKLLIAPISDDLKQAGAQTLMVSLDGALRYIPLAALHNGETYVVENYRLAIFTEAAKDKLKDAPQGTWRVAALGLTVAKPGFSALPSVKNELEGILKSSRHAGMAGEMHLDEAFTAKRMRDLLDKGYPVLHVASHFKFQPGTEANSFLLLGDGNRLTLKDIQEDDYHFGDVDLVTLSACETAVGGGVDANGMEIEGLGALAQKQGAKAVIATLWPVADESTGLLMQSFYQLREGGNLTKAEALRQAQINFIRGGHTTGAAYSRQELTATRAAKPASIYTHPYYWAPFILMGNWL